MRFFPILISMFFWVSCSQKSSPLFMNQNYYWEGKVLHGMAHGFGHAYQIGPLKTQTLRFVGNTEISYPKGKGNWYADFVTSGNWDEGSCLDPIYYLREISLSESGTFQFIEGGRILKLTSKSAPNWHPLYYLAQADSVEVSSSVDSMYLLIPGVSNPDDAKGTHYFFSGESSRSGINSKSRYTYFLIEVDGEVRYRIMQTVYTFDSKREESWEIIYQKGVSTEDLTKYLSFLSLKTILGL